jgi:glycerol-3-phosphate acyltransferase PlsY
VPVVAYILTAVVAYLLGSIPTGYLVAKARGIDIRMAGSGNIGATNAMRVLGKPMGIFVLLMDALKGFVACALLAAIFFAKRYSVPDRLINGDELEHAKILAGIFVILGHNFTCWLKFKGGKGIATTGGVYLALAPWAVLIGVTAFILAVLATRYVSIGSIVAAVALPVAVWILPPHNLLMGIVTTALGVMAIYKHRGNIQRLMAGTESRLGKKATTEVPR